MKLLKFGSERIVNVHLVGENDPTTIALITLSSGSIQSPKWKSLQRYWSYAKYSEIEYSAFSISRDKFLCCFTVASGQGGIIALWDCNQRKWLHISEAAYVWCAQLNWEYEVIISLHYVSYWGVRPYHEVLATPITGIKDGGQDISYKLNVEYFREGFNLKDHCISEQSLGDYSENVYGPLGIFYDKKHEKYYIHDCGNLYKFSLDGLRATIKK